MRKLERGSSLVIAVVVVLIIAVIGVGMVRFTQRETAGAMAGQRADAVAACAAAAQQLLLSRFHLLGVQPTDLSVLNVKLDGTPGRLVALGGHIGSDPSQPLATIKQVEPLPSGTVVKRNDMSDETNFTSTMGRGTGLPLKITVHCQSGDTSTPTSGRQLEIEYGVNFGM
jgi:type II secretory pathway pseudopilin PulG